MTDCPSDKAYADTDGYPLTLRRQVVARCTPGNPCPDRPRRRLGRFTTRPWRCTQCGRWWVTYVHDCYVHEWEWCWKRADPYNIALDGADQ